jgi:hypothetical protein
MQYKNIQIQLEKHYCSLIKQIIKGIVNLEELGDVEQMSVRALLEVGAQKVIEHRIKVRNEQSNEKKEKSKREMFEN